MKKKILKPITIAAVAFIAGYNIYLANVDNYVLTDMMLANVEALAQDESGGVIISCSESCRDGIGKCWTTHRLDPNYCERSAITTNYCSCAHLPG